MSDLGTLLADTADRVASYRQSLTGRPVAPVFDPGTLHRALGGPLPDEGVAAEVVIDELARAVEPGLVATTGPRYFGFVTGGALDSATAADMLATGWDQMAFNTVTSPTAAAVEDIAGQWLKEVLGLPTAASFGLVTGCQGANTTALAVARHHVLASAGWDVEQQGLNGAPGIRVLASAERHATIDRSLRLLGLGAAAVVPVPADRNGAIEVSALIEALATSPDAPTIVCLQAGNVNTGAFDDFAPACDSAHRQSAWVHIDGAFGLWAGASPSLRHLVKGVELADSWALDGRTQADANLGFQLDHD